MEVCVKNRIVWYVAWAATGLIVTLHNVVSPEQNFKSPVLDTDEMFSHTFAAAGTYKYDCSIHPRMTGQVVVR
jgi:plastocyanin